MRGDSGAAGPCSVPEAAAAGGRGGRAGPAEVTAGPGSAPPGPAAKGPGEGPGQSCCPTGTGPAGLTDSPTTAGAMATSKQSSWPLPSRSVTEWEGLAYRAPRPLWPGKESLQTPQPASTQAGEAPWLCTCSPFTHVSQ